MIRRIIQHYLDADDFQRAGTWALRHGDVETARDLRKLELLTSACSGLTPPEDPEGLTDDVIDLAAVNALAGIVHGDLDATELWARWHRSRTSGAIGPEEGTLGVFLSVVLGLAPAPAPSPLPTRNRHRAARTERDVRFAVTELARADEAFAAGDLPLAVHSYRVIAPLTRRLPTMELWRSSSLALIHALQHNWPEAASALDRVDESVVDTRGNPLWVGREVVRALLADHAGDATGAQDRFTTAVAGLQRFERFETVIATTQFASCLALQPLAETAGDAATRTWLRTRAEHLRTRRPGLDRLCDAVGALTRSAASEPDLAGAEPDATGLTPAELRVLTQLGSHLKVPEIARELCLSAATVRTHTALIYKKLGVHSRSGAVVAAERLGLLGNERTASAHRGGTRAEDHAHPAQRQSQAPGRG